ncbi:MAG TPA: hypothetical protein DCZ10_19000 [Pelotomaculum sp.]|nr:hypothetical protein [Pelotomaculum sp.]
MKIMAEFNSKAVRLANMPIRWFSVRDKKRDEGLSSSEDKPRWINFLLLLGALIGALFFILPPPVGVSINGWRVLGLLIPIIIVWATEALPVGVSSMLFLSLTVAFHLVGIEVAFKGFTSHLPWLMAGAFAIGVAMQQTGLSKRMAYYLLSRLNNFWGLILGTYLVNICLMSVPSSSARSGILAPILKSITTTVSDNPKSNFSRWLTYLFCTATDAFVGQMFLTGGASNAILIGLYSELSGHSLNWGQWIVIMAIPAIIFSLFATFGSLLFGRPEPELIAKVNNSKATNINYTALGPMTAGEWRVLFIFLFAIFLWIIGSKIRLEPGITALIIMSIIFLPRIGVLKIEALQSFNWNIVLLIGAVMGVGGILKETGMIDVLSKALIDPILGPLSTFGLLGIAIGVIIIGFITHFLLPSPNNLSMSLPLLFTWGLTTAHLPMPAILAFLGMLTFLTDKIVLFPYQIPPYYVFLSVEVTDRPRFTKLLLKMYPIMVIAAIIGTFVAYALLNITKY